VPKCWQILFHGKGFDLKDDANEPVIGFYTVRRVAAFSSSEAEAKAMRRLLSEAKIRLLLSKQEKESPGGAPRIVPVKTDRITWLKWMFSGYAKGLVLYGTE
jgi:hypothetical protein